jgi:hypothetical protein
MSRRGLLGEAETALAVRVRRDCGSGVRRLIASVHQVAVRNGPLNPVLQLEVASASAARTRLGETGIVAWCDTGEFQQGVVVTITSCTVKIDRATRAHFRRGCLKDLHPTDVWRRAISTPSN